MYTEAQRAQRRTNNPGSDRDLGAGQEWKSGERNVIEKRATNAGMLRRVQSLVAEDGGWPAGIKSRLKNYYSGRGYGEWARESNGGTLKHNDGGEVGGVELGGSRKRLRQVGRAE